MQGQIEAPCQVLIQLLPPDPASLDHLRQAKASIVETTAQLASKNIKVCITLSAGNSGLPWPVVLAKLAPIIQQLDCAPVDATSEAWHDFSDSHINALLSGTNHITCLSLARQQGSNSFFSLLAKFGHLQQLELHLGDAAGLNHLSTLTGLLELHLTVTDERQSDIRCGDILDSNRHSLLHVTLKAKSWDDPTYVALSQISKLRSISLQVGNLRQVNAQALAQLRPSQAMSLTFKKGDLVPGIALQDLTYLVGAHITDLTLHVPTMMGSWLRTMQHLLSLVVVGTDLTRVLISPQPRLQTLTLNGFSMSSSQLEDIVESCPSVKHLSLIKCIRFSSDKLCTILRLRHLHTLCLTHLPGFSTAWLHQVEAVIRAHQCVGMSQPQVFAICKWGAHATELCIDCRRHPVLCGDEFDECRPTLTQKSWAKFVYPSSQVFSRGFWSVASMFWGAAGKASSYAHAVANCRSWYQFDEQHPLGLLVFVAMLGIHVACLKMPVSELDENGLHNGNDDADFDDDDIQTPFYIYYTS